MLENCTYGSEGGETGKAVFPSFRQPKNSRSIEHRVPIGKRGLLGYRRGLRLVFNTAGRLGYRELLAASSARSVTRP